MRSKKRIALKTCLLSCGGLDPTQLSGSDHEVKKKNLFLEVQKIFKRNLMPIYEYYCKGCDFKFELLQNIKENQSAECPKCNKLAKRQVSLPGGLVFKGSGFYITD
jgi:putative FmdB family regulatory protein